MSFSICYKASTYFQKNIQPLRQVSGQREDHQRQIDRDSIFHRSKPFTDRHLQSLVPPLKGVRKRHLCSHHGAGVAQLATNLEVF